MIINALSVDVEDYFQVSAFASSISRKDWEVLECRVERNVERILQLLSDSCTNATFFILGWIAQRYPELVKKIADQGHEIASHGFYHEKVVHLSEERFYNDILSAKKVLEDIAGVRVKGYRAPSFSINESNQWAFDCLSKAGYIYSSSIYPIAHDHYGMPNSQRFHHEVRCGFTEIPVSTLRVLGRNYPASGGGYFRLFPYSISRRMFRWINDVEKQPLVFYFHPWEIDPDQPKVSGISIKTKFRHYLNLHVMEQRLRRMLDEFRWDRMDTVFLQPYPAPFGSGGLQGKL